MKIEYLESADFLRQMAFLNFGITPRGKISQKLHLFCPEFRENPTYTHVLSYQQFFESAVKLIIFGSILFYLLNSKLKTY